MLSYGSQIFCAKIRRSIGNGLLVPFQMDGVPGVTFPGIKPGETFTYKFPIKQAGTYWYHSHSGLQEQSGHYGPIIIEPKGKDPIAFDREYIVVLSDWTFEDPHRVFSKLKKMGDAYNYQQRTLGDFAREVDEKGFFATFKDRTEWGGMRMSPADISDVTGSTYTYLINGHGPEDNWTGLFETRRTHSPCALSMRRRCPSSMCVFPVCP